MKTSDVIDVIGACFFGLMGLGLVGWAFYVRPSGGWTLFSIVVYTILFLILTGVLLGCVGIIYIVLKDWKDKL